MLLVCWHSSKLRWRRHVQKTAKLWTWYGSWLSVSDARTWLSGNAVWICWIWRPRDGYVQRQPRFLSNTGLNISFRFTVGLLVVVIVKILSLSNCCLRCAWVFWPHNCMCHYLVFLISNNHLIFSWFQFPLICNRIVLVLFWSVNKWFIVTLSHNASRYWKLQIWEISLRHVVFLMASGNLNFIQLNYCHKHLWRLN